MKNDTKFRIMEIATLLFAKKGFAAVSVREVTDNANVNVSAISYYFKGKEGLYQAVIEEQFAPMRKARKTVENEQLFSPIERLKFYADMVKRIHGARPYLACFMMNEVINPTDYGSSIIKKHLTEVYLFVRQALECGVDLGFFRKDLNIVHAAITLAGSLNFYFIVNPLIKQFVFTDGKDTEDYTCNAFDIYLNGIKDRDYESKKKC